MADLLGGKNIYDDDGALITSLPFSFKNGAYSYSLSANAQGGSPLNLYDGLTTTGVNVAKNIG